MKIIRGIRKINRLHKPVLALGVFDGLHRGHRKVLFSAVKQAHKVKGTSVCLTFWPHPQKRGSLYSLEHRLRLIAKLGIDVCVVVNFNRRFSEISAQEFISEILVKKIGVKFVYVGKNFRFGRQAKGDYRLLEASAKKYNFQVRAFDVVMSAGKPISSTLIRKLIKEGKIRAAAQLLGRPVSVLGTVIQGSKLGRIFGVPTANINPHHEVIPPTGIYAVKIIFANKQYNGACYLGTRPTVTSRKNLRVEAHIFKFHKNIYGKFLEIQFIKLIRPDRKFATLESLVIQIKEDIRICHKILA